MLLALDLVLTLVLAFVLVGPTEVEMLDLLLLFAAGLSSVVVPRFLCLKRASVSFSLR